MNLRLRILFIAMCFSFTAIASQDYTLNSPDGAVKLKVTNDSGLKWSVYLNDKEIIDNVTISMTLGDEQLPGISTPVSKSEITHEKNTLYVPVPHKDKEVIDEYNELTLEFGKECKLVFRAYNEGIAYRFITDIREEIIVSSEQMDIRFPGYTTSLFPFENSLYSHFEPLYTPTALDTLKAGQFCSLPALFLIEGVSVLVTEAGLHDYPGLFLEGTGGNTLQALFPKYVLETIPNEANFPDRNEIITKKAPYISKTEGNREFPWRLFIISNDDRVLVENNLVYQLSRPLQINNTGWIKPGKVAWDWYNANNIFNVDFESGINTATYKYYIDFASENGIEYVILDEGWTKSTTEILECNPDLDVEELIDYGAEKNVGIILWVLWKPLNENMKQILDTYSDWGAKGIKVDFMQRADQYMVNSYAKIAEECAARELLVDYHGAFKPAGLRREFPNVLSYEGVKGNENNKWSRLITPEHSLILPFIRMVAGPMDFTPGSMKNFNEENFRISFNRPGTMGTRCHQVAMYVVYESPLQMLCENPSIYKQEQETLDFITQIPTTWDETRVIEASLSDYILVARRKGNDWYIGAMTDQRPRELEIDLSFLPQGSYHMEIMQDGINAGKYAEDYKKSVRKADNSTKFTAMLAPGGGWAAILKRE